MGFYGAGAQEYAPFSGTSHKCSPTWHPTWHYSVGCQPTEVVPYQGQHGPVIRP